MYVSDAFVASEQLISNCMRDHIFNLSEQSSSDSFILVLGLNYYPLDGYNTFV